MELIWIRMWWIQEKRGGLTEVNVLARIQISWSFAGKWDGEGILGRKDSMVKSSEAWNNAVEFEALEHKVNKRGEFKKENEEVARRQIIKIVPD